MLVSCPRLRDPDRTLPVRVLISRSDTHSTTVDLSTASVLRRKSSTSQRSSSLLAPRAQDLLPSLSQSSELSFDASTHDKEAVFNTTFRLSPDRLWKPKTAKTATSKTDLEDTCEKPVIRLRKKPAFQAVDHSHGRSGSEVRGLSQLPPPQRPIRILHRLTRRRALA